MNTSYAPYAAQSSTATIFGKVMTLVAAAIGFTVLGTILGASLSRTSSMVFYFGALAMLFAPMFVSVLRTGPIGMAWLMGIGTALGLAIGPAINMIMQVEPGLITQAAGLTALTTLFMGTMGFAIDKDLSGWMRTLSIIINIAVVVSIAGLVFGGLGALSPIISLVILVASALALMVDFNYVRHRATEDDVVWLATSMFVSILNIFLSILNLASDD